MSPHDAETIDMSADLDEQAEPLPPAPLTPATLVSELRDVISRQAITHRLPIDERLAGVLAREQAQVIVSLLEERGGLAIE